jgi:hypothetical protein
LKERKQSVEIQRYDDDDFWYLTPLSAIFQLYRGDQF